jgi:hypothetical protein
MRKILALAASLCFVASVAAAQVPSQSAASKADLLSMDRAADHEAGGAAHQRRLFDCG